MRQGNHALKCQRQLVLTKDRVLLDRHSAQGENSKNAYGLVYPQSSFTYFKEAS